MATAKEKIAEVLAALPSRALVGIDGVDGAGKTTLADQLQRQVTTFGRQVVRASVDGFHNPRAVRYRRGRTDPEGYFLDSYNYGEIKNHLIEPFRNGERLIQVQRFNYVTDSAYVVEAFADFDAILMIDGIFLHRDELWRLWDYSLFLDVPFGVSFKRMAIRDGTDPNPNAESNHRYIRGQLIYLARARPKQRASLVLEG